MITSRAARDETVGASMTQAYCAVPAPQASEHCWTAGIVGAALARAR
jgi:hypothetical protein